jgi:hypothetical protein
MTNLELARGALADIAFSDDMTLELARAKAKRVYDETTPPVEPTCLNGYRIVPTMGLAVCADCGKELL